MKKTITIISSILIITGLTASCDKPVREDGARLCHIDAQTATFGSPMTRTQVGELDGDNLLIDWTPGDQIGIITSNSTVSCFTNQTAEASANGDFVGLLTGTPTRAFYPYIEGVTDITAVPFCIPTDQIYTGPESIGQYDVRVAGGVSSMTRSYGMQFNSLTCLLCFEVDLNGLTAYTEMDEETGELLGEKSPVSFYPGESVTFVNMSIGNQDLTCGDEDAFFLVDMSSEHPGLQAGSDEGSMSPTVNVNLEEYEGGIPVSGASTAVFYAVVAPGAVAGEGIDLEIDTMVDGRYYAHAIHFTATLAADMTAGNYYRVPITASSLNSLEDVHCYDWELLDSEEGDEEEDWGSDE